MAIKTENKNIKSLVLETVNEYVDFIKPTYGPAENNIMIDKQYSSEMADDGVTIANEYKFEDPIKNAIINQIKKVAKQTNNKVGDGSTSFLIMVQAIIKEASKSSKNSREIVEELKKAVKEVRVHLTDKAKKITSKEDLIKIAKISFNDEKIATLIATLIYDLGPEGVIIPEDSNTTETTIERAEGLEFNSGYLSPYMVNTERLECELQNPYILLTNFRLTNGTDVLPIMEKLHAKGEKNLVIIAEHIEGDALAIINLNRKLGNMNVLAIDIPHGEKSDFLDDLAILTGATPFTINRGLDFTQIDIKDLGRCNKIVSKQDKTVITGASGSNKVISKAIKTLKELLKDASSPYEKDKIARRLSKFTNGIAVIKVGAATETEAQALRFKIDDAVNAVKAAYRGGVVCGAGLALARTETSSSILNKALKYPFNQLKENSELDIEAHTLKNNEAINAITKEVGDFLKLGIIDPAEVLIAGVESAVSISSLLITNKGIIYEVPEKQ